MLTPESLRQLSEFLDTDPILVFDYDGTLCPIVDHPDQTALAPEVRGLLNELCVQRICAVLTGRSRADILPKLEGIALSQVVGSHGADWPAARETGDRRTFKWVEQVADWKRSLEPKLQLFAGVEIEDKQLSLSVHYRHAADHAHVKGKLAEVLSHLHGARVIGGKEVFNVLPTECAGKGQAVRELKRAFGRETALFVGDDVTDEEAFELPESERVFKIRVGYGVHSQAEYYLEAQAQIAELLRLLLRSDRVVA